MIKYAGRHESDFEQQGKDTVTLCNHHPDQTPSLKIYKKQQRYFFKCFSCGFGGDGVSMAMYALKLDKRDKAEQRLMDDFDIKLPDKVELAM
jgi:DNA primase